MDPMNSAPDPMRLSEVPGPPGARWQQSPLRIINGGRHIVFGLALVLLYSCAAGDRKASLAPARQEGARRLSAADDLRRSGTYVALKQAVSFYRELYARPDFKALEMAAWSAEHPD